MADPLYELLLPHLKDDGLEASRTGQDRTTSAYLERLSTLSLKSLTSTEEMSLSQASQSVTRSLQALSKRSHGSITTASNHLKDLPELLASISGNATAIKEGIKTLESASNDFAQKYERSTENKVLEQRRTAALLNRSYDRMGNILELPSLLSSTINASALNSNGGTTAVTSTTSLTGYASALDLHAHIKRLRALYPTSPLITSIVTQSDTELANMTTVLITTLQSPTLKLAVAMRTIGWLRRVAPELTSADDAALSSLFLVCRLTTLRKLLDALAPLRSLADSDTAGVQAERYLKRFVEVFREQSFAVISMHRSIFPQALPVPGEDVASRVLQAPALASLVPRLVRLLVENLEVYLPKVAERAARDSLLSQVLFCAGSLGRLGADFGVLLAVQSGIEVAEWEEAVRKHRVQAGRLEVLASGVGGRKVSGGVSAPASPVGA